MLQCPYGNSFCVDATPANVTPANMSTTPDPVNIFSGEAYFSSTDFSLGQQGPKLALFRKYRSFSNINGLFGFGWRTDFDINLTQDGSGNVTIYDAQGTQLYFSYNPNNTYSGNMGNYDTLVKNIDSTFTRTDKHGIMYIYDTTGRLIYIIDRNYNSLSLVYNPSVPGGTYIEDSFGRQITLNIDNNGHIISAVDPDGKTFQYGYDNNGNLSSVTDPTGAVTNYMYDSNHKIIQFTNANGHNTYYQYDNQGRVIMTSQDNNVNKRSLDYQANNTTVVTDSLGHNSTYVFNDLGLQTSYTDPAGNVTQQSWDVNINRKTITDQNNNTTSFEYDNAGNLTQTVDPFNNPTLMSYTPDFNLIASKTDALNHTTSFSYDNSGNLTGITDALNKTRNFVYDQYGNVVVATDTRGNSTYFTYDIFGHLVQKTDALGHSTNFTYE